MEPTYTKALEEFDEWFNKNIPNVNLQKVYDAISIVDWLMQSHWAKRLKYVSAPDGNTHKVYDGLKTISEALTYLFVYITQIPSVYHDKIIKLMREVNKGDGIETEYSLKIKKIKEIINS